MVIMSRRTRIEGAMKRAGYNTQTALARALGVSQANIFHLLNDRSEMPELLLQIAKLTNVSFDWLRFGDRDQAPSWWIDNSSPAADHREALRLRDNDVDYVTHPNEISVVGTVVAGDGVLSDQSAYVEDGAQPLSIPSTWQAVLVQGMSAYPVVYPGQLVFIDTARAISPNDPETWTEKARTDLHDNLVLIQTEEPAEIGKATEGHRAYLKRFCKDNRAPDGYVLSSLDGGRSSPYVPAGSIIVIVPVVGVLFQDPRQPRKKRWHAKTVVATVHP